MFSILGILSITILGLALLPTSADDDESLEQDDFNDNTRATGRDEMLQEISDISSSESIADYPIKDRPDARSKIASADLSLAEKVGDEGENAILGGNGADLIVGGAGEDLVQGGAGCDVLDGVSEEDQPSADYLRGGSGDDILIGGALDLLSGGTGNDCFFIDGRTIEVGGTIVEDFNAEEDEILIGYDAEEVVPVLSLQEYENGTNVLINEIVLLKLEGVSGLCEDAIGMIAIPSA